MLVLLALHLIAALCAPLLVRRWRQNAFYILAIVPASTTIWAVAHTGETVVETVSWVPILHLDLALRMNALSWLMVLLVSGIGALVLVYCARYFDAGEPGLGRFAGVLVGFAGAMLGLVISDDLLLLYVFWELTTVLSYLLIGHNPAKKSSRRAAMQALIVTTLGGLAMLVGLIMLGQHAGTYRLSEIVHNAPSGAYLVIALVLILAGALSKSAIFPFSFWLPAAMAAPTPVSAYLHAAAMVKAGVYLIAQLAPFFALTAGWRPTILILGIITMLFGGWRALRQYDLKLLLAYGTVSQLGFLVVVLGAGGRDTALAGAALLTAHALFKATLFLVVGIIDHNAGTRDLRKLSGLWRSAPTLCVSAVLALASMAGLPPLFGFVAKEAVYEAFLHGGTVDRIALAGMVLGSAFTVAYSARFGWGAFATKAGLSARRIAAVHPTFLAPAALLALGGLACGLLTGPVDTALAAYAGPGDFHLALWHGLTPAVALSAVSLGIGGLLFAAREKVQRISEGFYAPADADSVYRKLMYGVDRLAVEVTGATQRGSLPIYLGVILLVVIALPGTALLLGRPWPDQIRLWDNPVQLLIGVVMAAAAILALRARRRLKAVVLVGVAGYGTAMMFVLYGAPDLALTQFLVETVTLVVFVLVLRRLPTFFSDRPLPASRWIRLAVAVAVGALMSGLTLAAVGAREATPISVDFPERAVSFGGGSNIVNVILVDIRAWDTMGELSVLVVAATGVASLIFLRRRTGELTRARDIPARGSNREWLRAGRVLAPERRSVIFEVVTRLIFHTIVVFSVYLVFSGHNAPGGGFAGGLVAGLALVVRYLAGGRYELNEAAPVDAGFLLGGGLLLAVGTGVAGLALGGDVLQTAILDFSVPVLGHVHLVTSVFFDLGVYLIVVGLMLDILRSLGSEVDRQIEHDAAEREFAEGNA